MISSSFFSLKNTIQIVNDAAYSISLHQKHWLYVFERGEMNRIQQMFKELTQKFHI